MLVNSAGMTLYTFDKDSGGKSACNDQCAKIWPPVMAAADAKPSGDLTVITRDDGKEDLVIEVSRRQKLLVSEGQHIAAGTPLDVLAEIGEEVFSLNLLWDLLIADGRAFGVVHGGLNLYNNGFAAGIVASLTTWVAHVLAMKALAARLDRAIGLAPDFAQFWLGAWLASWGIAFPLVLVITPLTRRLVEKLVRA